MSPYKAIFNQGTIILINTGFMQPSFLRLLA